VRDASRSTCSVTAIAVHHASFGDQSQEPNRCPAAFVGKLLSKHDYTAALGGLGWRSRDNCRHRNVVDLEISNGRHIEIWERMLLKYGSTLGRCCTRPCGRHRIATWEACSSPASFDSDIVATFALWHAYQQNLAALPSPACSKSIGAG